MPTTVEPPPWITELPTDSRGFPVPAEAGWAESGEPKIALVATDRKVALAMRRACAVCGRHMPKGRPVYRAFAQSDAAQIRGFERESTQDLAGPLHKSCVLYSALVCPYLRERTSRIGKDSMIGPGERRGTRAAVMGFRDLSVLLFAGPHEFLAEDAPVPHIGYLQLCDDIPYRDGEELLERYREAVEADREFIDLSIERLYWRTEADLRKLGRLLRDDFTKLNTRTADYQMLIAPSARYVGFHM
jgi:hypothetical protein